MCNFTLNFPNGHLTGCDKVSIKSLINIYLLKNFCSKHERCSKVGGWKYTMGINQRKMQSEVRENSKGRDYGKINK